MASAGFPQKTNGSNGGRVAQECQMSAAPRNWWAGQFTFQAALPEHLNAYARERLAVIDNAHQVFVEKAMKMRKWLVVSLLFLNGGAAYGSRDAAIHHHRYIWLTVLFIAGIVISLVNGWLVQKLVVRQVPFFARARRYWSRVASEGLQDPLEEEALWRLSRKAYREAMVIPVSGLVTTGGFAWGYLSLMAR